MIFGWYGLGRMFIEGLRTDSLYFGPEEWGIRISQALAALILIATAALLIYFAIKKPNRPFYHKDNTNSKNVKKGKK
jgi:phosphatidylglycerol:prolipoprotein diacylglycerol transferase